MPIIAGKNLSVLEEENSSQDKSDQRVQTKQAQNGDILEDSEETYMNCLIANDDPSQLYCLKLICENLGFKVTTALNGYEAYEIV